MSQTIALLTELIAFDTTSRHSNLELIDWLSSRLQVAGVDCVLTFDTDKRKANLFATLGASKAPGLVLSGHTDVVPVDGQEWQTDPFKVQIKNNRLYGRGACDMKGFIAVCLDKVQEILDADLDVPVYFAFSYDEEVGCVGVNGLIADLQARNIKPKACVIGEPTSMDVIRAHKGMFFQRCHVHGKSSHSSLVHHGVNAVTMAAKTIGYIDQLAEGIKQHGPFDEAFDPPYSTLHCGVIRGGTANNIIPNHCQFDFEIRNLPGHDPRPVFDQVKHYTESKLLPGMHAVDPNSGFEWQSLAEFPGMDTPLSAKLIATASRLLNTEKIPGKVSYGTEGGLFQKAGIETIICGPGSIEQAHKPDEYVPLEQLNHAEQFVSALIHTLKDKEI